MKSRWPSFAARRKSKSEVTVKNMAAGRAKSRALNDRSAWLAERPGQTTIARDKLVEGIKELLAEIESAPSA